MSNIFEEIERLCGIDGMPVCHFKASKYELALIMTIKELGISNTNMGVLKLALHDYGKKMLGEERVNSIQKQYLDEVKNE